MPLSTDDGLACHAMDRGNNWADGLRRASAKRTVATRGWSEIRRGKFAKSSRKKWGIRPDFRHRRHSFRQFKIVTYKNMITYWFPPCPAPRGHCPGRQDMADPPGEPSGRKCARHVVIGGRGLVAGDGRVVDDDDAAGEEVESAAHAHTGHTEGACGAATAEPGKPFGVPPAPATTFPAGPPTPPSPRFGLVARDLIRSPGLIGALLLARAWA